MNIIDLQKLKTLFNKENVTSNKKLIVYLFFVGVSTIFWFLNALSKEYTSNLKYPVEYVNLPKDKVLVNKLPNYLNLRVSAFGFDILKYKLSSAFLTNPFDVNYFTNNRINNSSIFEYSLPTNQLISRLEHEISSEIKLLSIEPDTLYFEFSPILSKKVAIHYNVITNFEHQFRLGDSIKVEPDSITIRGPETFLDSVKCVETNNLVLEKLTKDTQKKVSLKSISGIEFSQKKVLISIPVERFTEAQKMVPINVENLPDSLILRLFPGEVKVSYFVGLKKYETVSADHFDLHVDYLNAVKSKTNRLKVDLTRSPDFVSNVRYYPLSVTYLIEKRNSDQ
ncbi:CdaR family protein [Ancylomarina longa]|uniref:YbbR-like domain-containing protein n=1 Tax=Ancylomarina longa TaxID=2487017 RepID=A0A434AXS8_9BACT|nr:CdaR family protein [Ancylomarina longa]RUT79220.1 hypothetical protein DLK05_05230 [Ancylomarina longa]